MKKALGGLAVLAVCLGFAKQASAELVINGGFETGDFTGWARSGNLGFTYVAPNQGGNFTPGFPHGGTHNAELGPVGSDGVLMEQLLPTIPGGLYDFNFWQARDGAVPNDFNASWNGGLVLSLVN